jgi:hypothetical protein
MTNYQQEAVEAAAQALDDHGWWMTTDDWESLCSCGEVLKPSLEYAGDAYRSHLATVALTAAEPYLRKKWADELAGQIRAIKVERPDCMTWMPDDTQGFGRASMRDQTPENVEGDAS